MQKISYVLGCLLGASTLVTALPSRADIPPIDACSSEGSSCDNVDGPDKSGICTTAQCSRRLPDGSFMTYDCLRCVALGGGGGASPGGGGGMGGEVTEPPLTGGTANSTGGTSNATGGKASTGGTTNASGGASSTTGGVATQTGGAAGSSGAAGKGDGDDGGCSVSPLRAERGLAALMTALGLSALFVSRRRR